MAPTRHVAWKFHAPLFPITLLQDTLAHLYPLFFHIKLKISLLQMTAWNFVWYWRAYKPIWRKSASFFWYCELWSMNMVYHYLDPYLTSTMFVQPYDGHVHLSSDLFTGILMLFLEHFNLTCVVLACLLYKIEDILFVGSRDSFIMNICWILSHFFCIFKK